MKEQVNKSAIEKLRDLVGMVARAPVKNPMYQRFNIGDKVKFFNQTVGAWDVGEVRSVRNRNTYTVQSAEYEDSLHEWNELRPID